MQLFPEEIEQDWHNFAGAIVPPPHQLPHLKQLSPNERSQEKQSGASTPCPPSQLPHLMQLSPTVIAQLEHIFATLSDILPLLKIFPQMREFTSRPRCSKRTTVLLLPLLFYSPSTKYVF